MNAVAYDPDDIVGIFDNARRCDHQGWSMR